MNTNEQINKVINCALMIMRDFIDNVNNSLNHIIQEELFKNKTFSEKDLLNILQTNLEYSSYAFKTSVRYGKKISEINQDIANALKNRSLLDYKFVHITALGE